MASNPAQVDMINTHVILTATLHYQQRYINTHVTLTATLH